MVEFKDIAIRGIAACAPASTMEISNSEILTEREKKTIERHFGIKRVHKSNNFTAFDLCLAAAENLLKSIQWNSSEVDFLISVTQTPDYLMPSNSGAYQQKLKLPKACIVFEVNTGCSGYVQAIMLASSLLQNRGFKKGLIVCGETTYNVSETDKASYPYMGDAGTATAIEFKPDAPSLIFNSISDGCYADSIRIPSGGARSYTSNFDLDANDELKVNMNGEKVKNFIFQETLPNIQRFFEASNLKLDQIDHFIFHQVNQLIIKNVAKTLEIPFSKLLTSFEEYGNNSSASIPVSICHNATQFNKTNKSIFLSGFGIGMSNYNVFVPKFNGEVLKIIYL